VDDGQGWVSFITHLPSHLPSSDISLSILWLIKDPWSNYTASLIFSNRSRPYYPAPSSPHPPQTCAGRSLIPPVIFLGNKKDLTDKDPDAKAVTSEDTEKLIQACKVAISRLQVSSTATTNVTWSVLHYETSALSGERIDEIFEVMIREIRHRRQPVVKKKSSWCFLF
jgi:hypothetical protein